MKTQEKTISDTTEIMKKKPRIIKDVRKIEINASPEKVFEYIRTMPNKFPVYRVLETGPFLFLRLLLVIGFRGAVETAGAVKAGNEMILKIGDAMGPFQLTQLEKPCKYRFTLNSFFFKCETGYGIRPSHGHAVLQFDLFADRPGLRESVWWFFIKPFHILLANKVLRVIKQGVENRE
jgi:hypothetical protein